MLFLCIVMHSEQNNMARKNEKVRGMPTVRLSDSLRSQINVLADKKGISRTAMLEKVVQIGLGVIAFSAIEPDSDESGSEHLFANRKAA